MFCCHTFKDLIANAGKRGLSVVVGEIGGRVSFTLQSRSIAYNDLARVKTAQSQFPENVTLAVGLMIQYCPSCGRNLDELAVEQVANLEQLACDHSRYQDKYGTILFAQE
jgi:hypothetical protein